MNTLSTILTAGFKRCNLHRQTSTRLKRPWISLDRGVSQAEIIITMPLYPKLEIADPRELLEIEGFEDAYRNRCQAAKINHVKFLGPGDSFSFVCRRLNTCCRNFYDAERINLDPYDVYRLSRFKKMSTGKFIEKYASMILDKETHLPMVLLKYQGEEGKNKCHFLRSYGCSVYKDRPLRCRLYPLGKISSKDKSYFMLVNNCPCGDCGDGKNWSVADWIDESECRPYFEFQRLTIDILEDYDREVYETLPEDVKLRFGVMLFDLDAMIAELPSGQKPKNERELRDHLSRRIDEFLASYGCLKRSKSEAAAPV